MTRKLCYLCEATAGGVRKHLRDLLRVFSRPEEGFAVSAILGDRGEPGLRAELDALQAERGPQAFHYTFVPALRRAICPWNDWRAYRDIKRLLRELNPDIVHTHSSKAGMLGRQAAHSLGLPNVIHTPHVFPYQWSPGLKGRVYLALERRAARFCRAIVCVGASQRNDALARGVAAPAKLAVITNGIELPAIENARDCADARRTARAALGLDSGVLSIGMVARLAPQKGVRAFVQAAALVLQQQPEAVFLVVGGGPLEAQVRARLAELRVPPANFRLLGHREDAAALYPGFDVVALSSLYEGLPYVLLEAMAWGVPVVATDVLGSRDVVAHGATGFLARVDDPHDIAAHIVKLLADPALRARCGSAARARVAQEFSFAQFIDGHRKLYQSL